MGLTPLEGLMMGTRSGDVDPHLPGFLADREGSSIEEVETFLNTRSGLLGVSGLSQDMRELHEAEQRGDARAALAVEMFCYRVKKQIGAYLAALGGADAVIFSGGIGENAPQIRARICSGMDWCGLSIDEGRNMALKGSEGRISRENAGIHAYVIPVNEELVIARDAAHCITARRAEVSGTPPAIRR
jgi:acetate kinase